MTFRDEGMDRPKTDDEPPDKTNSRNESYARRKRMELLRQNFLPLRTSKIEAKHILNSEIPLLVDPLESELRNLAIAMRGYFSEQLDLDRFPADDERKQRWLERQESWKELIYGTEDDEHGQAVNKAVDALIAGLEPFLK